MKTKWIWIIIIMSSVVVLTAYFSVFNSGVSNNANNWSSFGSYVSGLMMPILTVINIYVFIRLTTVLDEKNTKRQQNDKIQQEERRKEEIEHQQKLHNEELEFQKRKILTLFRQDALNTLYSELECFGKGENVTQIYSGMIGCLTAIDSFMNQKQILFSLKSNGTAYDTLINLHSLIKGISEKYISEGKVSDIKEVLSIKHKAITELQKYIIDNI